MVKAIDVHCHVSPASFPPPASGQAATRWPCMRCKTASVGTLYFGDTAFRELDDRSWNLERRLEDMDRDGIDIQVLSPMPELLSYWLDAADGNVICDAVNAQIASIITKSPRAFRGLGAIPAQDTPSAIRTLGRLRSDFGLSGIEIGSNVNGIMLGDSCFDPIWEAAESLNLAVFVHALHPVAVQSIKASPAFTVFAGFPIDVAMAASSLLMAGVPDRFPTLRFGFSHGGGALGSLLGRLDCGWHSTNGFGGKLSIEPSKAARQFFFDSNVYSPEYLRFLATEAAPGRIFLGSDYPYTIMQKTPLAFMAKASLDEGANRSLQVGAASLFLNEPMLSTKSPDIMGIQKGVH